MLIFGIPDHQPVAVSETADVQVNALIQGLSCMMMKMLAKNKRRCWDPLMYLQVCLKFLRSHDGV